MSEMIERVARAISPYSFDGRVSALAKREQRKAIEMARAAIEAMREPTADMVRAGFHAGCSYESIESDFLDAWRAMIDAALNDWPHAVTLLACYTALLLHPHPSSV